MIAKISTPDNFRQILEYLLRENKCPEILPSFMTGTNSADLAREFQAVADLRPSTQNNVRHISLAFATGDDVNNVDKSSIVDRVMQEMGYQNCQYVAINHHRDDPGHDHAHDHDHLHIVVNTIDFYGERVSDSFECYRIQEILRKIEIDFGLEQVKSSWKVKRDKAQTIYPTTSLSVAVVKSLETSCDLKTWLDRLSEDDIDVRFTLRKDGAVRGISYLKDGEIHKGSYTVGASWAIVDEKLGTSPADLPLITAANLKSNQHPIKISPETLEQLNHAAKMAIAALNGKSRLKTGRVDIQIAGETLAVYRMRPSKQMFVMSKTPQGWEPVGFPNLEFKDMDLLSKISGLPKDFVVTLPKIDEIVGVTASTSVAVPQNVNKSSPVKKKRRPIER
ncbi:relaxase/mobilization nuclease domain-containing protein [Chamaesiphon sp.]|uniref:relaxase/mobilization nuclease domain-containing protein n=1 Tax=Chamaesiphon sp. TaxID=2814140 RepID=UPI0035930FBC